MPMPMPSRDVVVLAVGQALTSTVVSLLTSVSSLSGAYLAPSPSLSTVPVTATVLGTLLIISRVLTGPYSSDDDNFIECFQITAPG